jgi:SAM-dependent methyltransferase
MIKDIDYFRGIKSVYINIYSEIIYRKITKSRIDLEKFSSIRSKYVNHAPPYSGYSKYFDIATYLKRDIKRSLVLGLNGQKKLRILDIGSGMGYFLLASEFWGHSPLGLDMDDSKKYRDVINFLGVNRLIGRVDGLAPIPIHDLSPFDLITAFQVTFNILNHDKTWGIAEWDFFIQDLRAHLTPSGRIYLQLNPVNGICYTQELYQYFKELGATINGAYIDINPAAISRA